MNCFTKSFVFFLFFGTVNGISGDWIDQEMHEQSQSTDQLPIGHVKEDTIPNYEREAADSFEKFVKEALRYQVLSGITVKLANIHPKSMWE